MKLQKLRKETFLLLQSRLQDEYNAFYFYRSAANWFENKGYFKAAKFCKAESDDELNHAKKIEEYMVNWNMTPLLPNIETPVLEFKDPVDFIEQAYEIEFDLYQAYELVAGKLFKAEDLGAFKFIQEFIQIQNNSVAEYSDKMNITEGTNRGSKFEMLMLEENLFEG